MPMGMDKWFPVLLTALPGMQAMMTSMMKKKMADKGVASLEELRELCQEAEVRLIACQKSFRRGLYMGPRRLRMIHAIEAICADLELIRGALSDPAKCFRVAAQAFKPAFCRNG